LFLAKGDSEAALVLQTPFLGWKLAKPATPHPPGDFSLRLEFQAGIRSKLPKQNRPSKCHKTIGSCVRKKENPTHFPHRT